MVELDDYPDASFDLAYSGQTIEHVDEDEADRMLAGVATALAPGVGSVLTRPAARSAVHSRADRRLYTPELINADHEIETSHEQLVSELERSGVAVPRELGIGRVEDSVAGGSLSFGEMAPSWLLGDVPAESQFLGYHCQLAGNPEAGN